MTSETAKPDRADVNGLLDYFDDAGADGASTFRRPFHFPAVKVIRINTATLPRSRADERF